MRLLLLLIFLALSTAPLFPAVPPAISDLDLDGDGLADSFEDLLLEKFRPTLRVSPDDCAAMPAEFRPNLSEPEPIAVNGTIYGQAFPVLTGPDPDSAWIELHYYHLWVKDCGPLGHRLDAEFVAALATAADAAAGLDAWTAKYWFAAAHQGTLCDSSNGARADAVGAVHRGPEVWVSEGKHASFLTLELCNRIGCGSDRCQRAEPVPAGRLINLGEQQAPLNGAVWTASPSWPLASKMGSQFEHPAYRRFAPLDLSGVDVLSAPPPPTQAVLLAGNRTITAAGAGGSETGKALGLVQGHTGNVVKRGMVEAGRSFVLSVKRIGGWLGLGRPSAGMEPQ